MAPGGCTSSVPAEGAQVPTVYHEAAAAFDIFAADYDEWVGEHVSARRAKAEALLRIRRHTRPGDLLLDVGCGTGSEAVKLARLGRRVVAVDVSNEMLRLAAGKAAARGLDGAVSFRRCSAAEVDAALVPAGYKGFDLAYSIYGVLNLEPDPARALARIAAVVRPGGRIIIGLLNPTVLHELVVFPFALHFKGFRKALAPRVELKVSHGRDESVACVLPSVPYFARAGGQAGLTLEEAVGVHIVLPPPSQWLVSRFPALVALVSRLESRVQTLPPWNRLGYFSLLTFRRLEG